MSTAMRALGLIASLAACSSETPGGSDGGAGADGAALDAAMRIDADVSSCTDGVQGEFETGVDCGGGVCPRCADDTACLVGGDCISLYCRGGACQPLASCANGMRDGLETDTDCGGAICAPCAADRACEAPFDCESLLCSGGTCRALPATCSDGATNGSETDMDCGGAACAACADGAMCGGAADCRSGTCGAGACCGNTAGLSWDAPDMSTDGTCANDIAGFRAYWGMAAGERTFSQDIPLDDLALVCAYTGPMGTCAPVIRCFYRLSGLPAGPLFFVVTAYDTSANESDASIGATKTIYPCP